MTPRPNNQPLTAQSLLTPDSSSWLCLPEHLLDLLLHLFLHICTLQHTQALIPILTHKSPDQSPATNIYHPNEIPTDSTTLTLPPVSLSSNTPARPSSSCLQHTQVLIPIVVNLTYHLTIGQHLVFITWIKFPLTLQLWPCHQFHSPQILLLDLLHHLSNTPKYLYPLSSTSRITWPLGST